MRSRAILVTAILGATFAGPLVPSATGLSKPAATEVPVPQAALCQTYPCYTLTISLSGTGSGSYTSTNSSYVPDGHIHCAITDGVPVAGNVCSYTYVDVLFSGVVVYWLVAAGHGSVMCGELLGECVNAETPIPIYQLLKTNRFFSYSFNPGNYIIHVTTSGTGTGKVTSIPSGLNCPPTCDPDYVYGTPVSFTATPDPGAYFAGWTGLCVGQTAICSFAAPTTSSTNAVFMFGSPPASQAPPTAGPTARSTRPPSLQPPSATPTPGPIESLVDSPSATSAGTVAVPTAAATSPGSQAPAVAAGLDLTPIILAILGAGLIIAAGIGVAAFVLTRRRAPP
jgi:hypothetical protein